MKYRYILIERIENLKVILNLKTIKNQSANKELKMLQNQSLFPRGKK